VRAEGTFQAGDAVDVVPEDAAPPVGKGISAMSCEELRSVAGMRSEAMRRRLPDADPVVIHRDAFVLAERPATAPARGLMGAS
jgi:glutamate 5-kinase